MILQNKFYEILENFLGDYTRDIYGRELIGKINLSQKGIALTLDELEKKGILKSNKKGNIKLFRLNIENPEIKDIISQVELNKKIKFLSDNRALSHIFSDDNRILGIFGSYASNTQKKDSDVDVFVIGPKRKEDYDAISERFDIDISIKYFSEKEFIQLLKDKNNLCKEIIRNHTLLFGIEQFIKIIWGNYYGFN